MTTETPRPVLVCIDGSDHSLAAARAGLALVADTHPVLVAMVADEVDPMLLTGTGMASGLPPEQYQALHEEAAERASTEVRAAAEALGLDPAATRVLTGGAGVAICDLAAEVGAAAVVMGSRGRSGVKRAILGSVSDHVVRHAPCTVVITGPEA